jgi:hypothetical protein
MLQIASFSTFLLIHYDKNFFVQKHFLFTIISNILNQIQTQKAVAEIHAYPAKTTDRRLPPYNKMTSKKEI